MLKKPFFHKLFLILSAAVVLHGTITLLLDVGIHSLDSYTVLTNLLMVLIFPIMAFLPKSNEVFRSYLSFAVLVCISVTGIVYNFVLVPFEGQPMVFIGWGNFVTHLLSMLLAYINYLAFEEKGKFSFRHILVGLLPPLLYWTVYAPFGHMLNFNHYNFMMPREIGWFMVIFWFTVIMIFVVGLMLALIFFDNKRKRSAALSVFLSGIICFALVFTFGGTAPTTLIFLSYTIEDVFALEDGDSFPFGTAQQLEEGISLPFRFFTLEERVYTIDFSSKQQGIISVFLIKDEESSEVVFQAMGESLSSSVELELHESGENNFIVSWIFFNSYENISAFFSRMSLGHITEEERAYFVEVFSRDGLDRSAYISFRLR